MPSSTSPPDLVAAHELDLRAKTYMQQGIELLAKKSQEDLRLAIGCFDDAITLRRQLPLSENPWFRYGLIAAWMNRGDALTRIGTGDELREALHSFDEALAHLRELPMIESPLFVKRLAIAWLNRGIALLAQGSAVSVREALSNFDDAVAAARNFAARDQNEGRDVLSCALMNRGATLMRWETSQPEPARVSVKEALSNIAGTENEAESAAEIGLKARLILCQAIASLLATPALDASQRDALVAEATDAVDEGLTLARFWEERGAIRFRAQAADLFQFGCRVYQIYQPHFLTEFLLETIEHKSFVANLQMHSNATEAVWRALAELQREGFKQFNTPKFEQTLERLQELKVAEERLADLRRRHTAM